MNQHGKKHGSTNPKIINKLSLIYSAEIYIGSHEKSSFSSLATAKMVYRTVSVIENQYGIVDTKSFYYIVLSTLVCLILFEIYELSSQRY